MKIFITGIAGFIGSNLARYFLDLGLHVCGADNLCRGSKENINDLFNNPNFYFSECDLSILDNYENCIQEFIADDHISEIWHLAANSDILTGTKDANLDLRDTFFTTFNTLEIMKKFDIKKIFFSSSSAIYGDLGEQKLKENSGPLLPISNYGAMKLASEALLSAASESFLLKVGIFRFPNVVGTPATHGVILDFIQKLKSDSSKLHVLGNGTQQKVYIHIKDLIEAMLFIRNNTSEKLAYYNIGPDDQGVTVKFIAEQTLFHMNLKSEIIYGILEKGWLGDVPKFSYSIEKLRSIGWEPKHSSAQAITKAIQEILVQEGLKFD